MFSTEHQFAVKVMTKPEFTDGTKLFIDLSIKLNNPGGGSFAIPLFNDFDGDSVEITIEE